MDHVIPRSHGGYWELENLRPAHYGCNSSRGNREPPRYARVRSRHW
ncbi:HNH endonuclease [Microcella sp.]